MALSRKLNQIESLANLPRNDKNVNKLPNRLQSLLGYNFEISTFDKHWFSAQDDLIKRQLGQVETPAWIANLISRLCISSKNDSVLDPCFGNGVFLNAALKRLRSLSTQQGKDDAVKQVYGVEIDPFLFVKGLSSILSKNPDCKKLPPNFFNGDIFDFKGYVFDVIIFNPPYIRQEDLSKQGVSYLNKEIIAKKSLKNTNGISLSSRSNLYSYFIVHLTKFLSKSGRMGIIIPKVWLDSKYGKTLQEFLLNNYEIQYIIDFDRDTFSNVIVEDCVLILKKSSKISSKTKTRFVHVKKEIENDKLMSRLLNRISLEDEFVRLSTVNKKTLLADPKWGKFLHVPPKIISVFENNKLIPLEKLADVDRGITTNWNSFFMHNNEKLHSFKIEKEFLKSIIKSPKDIENFDTCIGTTLSSMLLVEEPIIPTSSSEGIREYLKEAIASLRDSNQTVTIKRMIEKEPKTWYLAPRTKSGPIIFSYIIRQMKNFIYNSKEYLIRDNFYAITPKGIDPLLIFGLLNSTLVKLNLELIGRRYGNGLLKIQAYELAEMPIPNINHISKKHIEGIRTAAQQLKDCKITDKRAGDLIKKIDEIIHEYLGLDINPEQLGQVEKQLREKRLRRVGRQS